MVEAFTKKLTHDEFKTTVILFDYLLEMSVNRIRSGIHCMPTYSTNGKRGTVLIDQKNLKKLFRKHNKFVCTNTEIQRGRNAVQLDIQH